MKKQILKEAHKDVVSIIIRCRIKIEDRDDPTLLDIMTDMRALPGIVTVRQNLPLSDIIDTVGHRIAELKVTYIPSFVEVKSDILMSVLKSLKTIKGVDMIKLTQHDDVNIMNILSTSPIVI